MVAEAVVPPRQSSLCSVLSALVATWPVALLPPLCAAITMVRSESTIDDDQAYYVAANAAPHMAAAHNGGGGTTDFLLSLLVFTFVTF